jgi:hypothetical protein
VTVDGASVTQSFTEEGTSLPQAQPRASR